MSENKKYYFLKLKEGYFKEETITLLESMKDGILYSNILLKLYCMSLKHEGKLQLYENLPLTTDMIARLTQTETGTVERAIGVFEQLHLIEELPDGCFYLSQIETMIGSTTTEAIRKKRARERLKMEGSGGLLPDKGGTMSGDVRALSKDCPPDIREQSTEEREESVDICGNQEDDFQMYLGSFHNVRLDQTQLDQLKEMFPEDWEERIERMSRYLQSTGKQYQDHFATLLLWADREKESETGSERMYETEGAEIL